MTPHSLVLGIDGGGTKTLGMLADAQGTILITRQVGASNVNVVGLEAAARNLAELVSACLAEAGAPLDALAVIVAGLAGAGDPGLRKELPGAIFRLLPQAGTGSPLLQVETDARIALEGAFGGGPGVVVIAGTGSIVFAKTPEGAIVRAGGWGRLLGDEGSGHYIGLEALRSLAQEIDGGMPSEFLRRECGLRFGLRTREEIIRAVYQEKFPVPSIAPVVLEGTEAGDGACSRILHQAAELLVSQVVLMVPRLGDREAGVVFVGGLVDHDTVYRRILADVLMRRSPRTHVQDPLYPPARGAVLMALEQFRGTRS